MTANVSLSQSVHIQQQSPDLLLNKSNTSVHDNTLTSISRKPMNPGIYTLSNEAYHKGSGVSRSALMQLRRSPYHYWYKHINPDYVEETDTSAMIFGNALHTLILEPEKFNEQFFVMPKFDKRTKAGAERWKQIQSELGDKTALTEAQYEELQSMEKSFHRNDMALPLIENAQIEPSLYWNDSDTGILCKSRPDILRSNLVCDLKTAHDGSPFLEQLEMIKTLTVMR